MISDEYFENLYSGLSGRTEEFSLTTLNKIRDIAIELSNDGVINLDREQRLILQDWDNWNKNAVSWVDNNLPKAYRKGIQHADARLTGTLQQGRFSDAPFFEAAGAGAISSTAQDILSDIPEHWTMYGAFQNAAYRDFDQTRLPVVRSTMDMIRDLTLLASDNAYLNSDTLTRRELSQELVRKFADKGITGITYKDGRRVQLDSYAEMVARTQTGNASRQAVLNRNQEYGNDLILVSQHYPTSDLCAPHQGKAYSISGTSNQYPPFSQTNSGAELFHVNCKHFISPYTAGQKIPEAREKVDSKENKERYKASQRQRVIERNIRTYKRREAVAVTKEARDDAKKYIRKWQKEARDNISSNSWMKRAYQREQI